MRGVSWAKHDRVKFGRQGMRGLGDLRRACVLPGQSVAFCALESWLAEC